MGEKNNALTDTERSVSCGSRGLSRPAGGSSDSVPDWMFGAYGTLNSYCGIESPGQVGTVVGRGSDVQVDGW